MSTKLLVIEDDPQIVEMIRGAVVDMGFDVDSSATAEEVIAQASNYDLILLDINLPGMNGVEACRRIRSEDENVPILIVSAQIEELDRVLGLEAGADDYLCKPFGVHEFKARIRALLRRSQSVKSGGLTAKDGSLSAGPIELNLDTHMVSCAGKELSLTRTEFSLLQYLVENQGCICTKEALLNHVWGYESGSYEATVGTHVSRLRGKVEENPSKPTLIQTVWGVGYRLVVDDKDQSSE